MKIVMKKPIIYLMVGIMQTGMFATVAEAASSYGDASQRMIQFDRRDDRDRHDRDRYERERHERELRRQHDEQLRRENERHEREMRRRHHESEREWRERQRRENERHEREIREIAALLIGIVIGSASNN